MKNNKEDWKEEFLKIAKGSNQEKLAQALLLIERTIQKTKQETERTTREKIRKMIWEIDERIDHGDSWSHGIRDDLLNDLSDNNKS